MLKDKNSSAMIPTVDIPRALHFYGELLGLDLIEEDSLELVLAFRTGATKLIVYHSHEAGSNRANAAVWTCGGDFDAIIAALEAKGVRFEHYPDLGSLEGNVHLVGTEKGAWLKDPDGNILHLNSM